MLKEEIIIYNKESDYTKRNPKAVIAFLKMSCKKYYIGYLWNDTPVKVFTGSNEDEFIVLNKHGEMLGSHFSYKLVFAVKDR